MMKMKKLAAIFLLEQMCVQTILPQMKSPFEMLVTVEYSEENDDADVIICYSGEKFDPTNDYTALPLILAKRATENIVYSFDGEKKLSNRVDAQI